MTSVLIPVFAVTSLFLILSIAHTCNGTEAIRASHHQAVDILKSASIASRITWSIVHIALQAADIVYVRAENAKSARVSIISISCMLLNSSLIHATRSITCSLFWNVIENSSPLAVGSILSGIRLWRKFLA